MLLILAGLTGLALITTQLFFSEFRFMTPALGVSFVLLVVGSFFLERGRWRWAANWAIFLVWGLMTYFGLLEEDFRAQAYVGHLLILVAAIILVGKRTSQVVLAASILVQFGIALWDTVFGSDLSYSFGGPWLMWGAQLVYLSAGYFFVSAALSGLKKTEQANEDLVRRYNALFENANDMIILIGLDRKILDINERGLRIIGYGRDEVMGRLTSDFVIPQEGDEGVMNQLRVGVEVPLAERKILRGDGREIYVEVNLILVRDEDGNPLYVQGIMRDITQRKLEESETQLNLFEMERLAMTDPLTGLMNRRAIEAVTKSVRQHVEADGGKMCLLMIDMDRLKEINDVYGHQAGDAALRHLAAQLEKSKRQNDWAGRWAGDEFLVVLSNGGVDYGLLVAERLRENIENNNVLSGKDKFQVTISIGVVECDSSESICRFEDLIYRVDKALYQSKKGGRNKVVVYEDGDEEQVS